MSGSAAAREAAVMLEESQDPEACVREILIASDGVQQHGGFLSGGGRRRAFLKRLLVTTGLVSCVVLALTFRAGAAGLWGSAHIDRLVNQDEVWGNGGATTSMPLPWNYYATTTTKRGAPLEDPPTFEFYMYRAASNTSFWEFPVGNLNTGNMDGVIWYLMNEVVTKYTAGVQCPRKFNISYIHRMKVKVKSTPELFNSGMSFSARYAYDSGKCMGRCFPGNLCSGEDDCDHHYEKYGYTVGCNNFRDNYPFPDKKTPAENGIWYTLPRAGLCDSPTGAHNCTWSYEYAGNISLWDLEKIDPWGDNCCGHCTGFWNEQFDSYRTSWRVDQALQLFQKQYPDMPRELEPAPCDFQWWKWYAPDRWEHRDPWATAIDLKK